MKQKTEEVEVPRRNLGNAISFMQGTVRGDGRCVCGKILADKSTIERGTAILVEVVGPIDIPHDPSSCTASARAVALNGKGSKPAPWRSQALDARSRAIDLAGEMGSLLLMLGEHRLPDVREQLEAARGSIRRPLLERVEKLCNWEVPIDEILEEVVDVEGIVAAAAKVLAEARKAWQEEKPAFEAAENEARAIAALQQQGRLPRPEVKSRPSPKAAPVEIPPYAGKFEVRRAFHGSGRDWKPGDVIENPAWPRQNVDALVQNSYLSKI